MKFILYLYVFLNIISYQPALLIGEENTEKKWTMELIFLSPSFIFISYFYLFFKIKISS
jgi:hypothetical protein